MWNRQEVKKEGKKHFRKNYWPCVIVCFLLAFLGCEYTSSANIIHGYDNDFTVPENVIHSTAHLTNNEILGTEDSILTTALDGIDGIISSIIALIGSIQDVILDNYTNAFILGLIFMIEMVYIFAICNPLIVGSRNFYIKNHENSTAKLSELVKPFKNKNILNIIKIMFLQILYLFFWLFTIIGFFVKIYEYRMISYILAENPNIKAKEAFSKTKQMMKGYKWELFKFDLSYLGWQILNIITLGFSGILYSNPYKSAATTEIYLKLKESTN